MLLQTNEHELLSGRNLGFPLDYPLVLECTPCVRRVCVQRMESPCRCCRSRGDGSQCGRGSPRSRWSEGRPSTMSSSRRTRRRACPLVSMLVRLSVLVGKTETKQERKKKETGYEGRWNLCTHHGRSPLEEEVALTSSFQHSQCCRAGTGHAWEG